MKEYMDIFKFYKNSKKNIFIIYFLRIIIIIISLYIPYIYGLLISQIKHINLSYLKRYVAILFALQTATIIFTWIMSQIKINMNTQIVNNLRLDIIYKLFHIPPKKYDINSGKALEILNEDVNSVINIVNILIQVSFDLVTVILIFFVSFRLNKILTFVMFVILPVSYFVNYRYSLKIKKQFLEVKKSQDYFLFHTNQILKGINEIKFNGSFIKISPAINNVVLKLNENRKNLNLLNLKASTINNIFNMLLNFVFIATGFFLIINNKLSLEIFVAFLAYSRLFGKAGINIMKIKVDLQPYLLSYRRLVFVEDLYCHSNMQTENSIDQCLIKFVNVSFKYQPDGNDILSDLSFSIEKNKKIAIIGESDCGKTTFLKLAINLLEADSGEIMIDGKDINKYNFNHIIESVVFVNQEPMVFHGTIKENLLLFRNSSVIEEEEILKACKAVNIYNDIMKLPDQFDTVVADNNEINLSIGQKQRLILARAVLQKAKVFLFDEPFTGLDDESILKILKVIDRLSKNHTVVIVTHQLNYINDYDEIYQLRNGSFHKFTI